MYLYGKGVMRVMYGRKRDKNAVFGLLQKLQTRARETRQTREKENIRVDGSSHSAICVSSSSDALTDRFLDR